jgi:dynein heavy chain 1
MVEGKMDQASFFKWLDSYQSQLVVISAQIHWTGMVENAIEKGTLDECVQSIEKQLMLLADSVLQEQPPIRRKKIEHLIMESVYQRDTVR